MLSMPTIVPREVECTTKYSFGRDEFLKEARILRTTLFRSCNQTYASNLKGGLEAFNGLQRLLRFSHRCSMMLNASSNINKCVS